MTERLLNGTLSHIKLNQIIVAKIIGNKTISVSSENYHKYFSILYCKHSLLWVLFQKYVFMPPTSKKLRGHIGLGLSVQSVCQ